MIPLLWCEYNVYKINLVNINIGSNINPIICQNVEQLQQVGAEKNDNNLFENVTLK